MRANVAGGLRRVADDRRSTNSSRGAGDGAGPWLRRRRRLEPLYQILPQRRGWRTDCVCNATDDRAGDQTDERPLPHFREDLIECSTSSRKACGETERGARDSAVHGASDDRSPEAADVQGASDPGAGSARNDREKGGPSTNRRADKNALEDVFCAAAFLIGGDAANDPAGDEPGDDHTDRHPRRGSERSKRKDRHDHQGDDCESGEEDSPEAPPSRIRKGDRISSAVGIGRPAQRVVDGLNDWIRTQEDS